MKKISLLLLLPFIIYFSYFYAKPLDTSYHHPLRTELEYLSLDKKTEFTKSKIIIYKSGEIRLDFFVENKQNLDAKAYIEINHQKKFTLLLKNKEHTLRNIKVQRGDYLQINIDKSLFKKEDGVVLNLQYRAVYQYYEEILIVLFWILFAVIAFKKSIFLNFILVYASYLFILYSEQVAFGSLALQTNLSYIFLSLFIFSLALFIRRFIAHKGVRVVVTFLLYVTILTPFVLSDLYCSSTSSMISKQVIDALLQTNIQEAGAYIKDFMDVELFISFVLFLLLIFYLIVKADSEKLSLKSIDYLYMAAIFLFLLFGFRSMHLYGVLLNTLDDFANQEIKYKKLSQNRVADLKNLYAVKKGKGETYVVVIGESQNKHHMSLYGYFRNTTPYLEKEKSIIKYTNAFSTQVYTTGVLSKALTESDGVNNIDYLHAYSIVEIAKKAGFTTYWLTNQVLKGGWDNVISVVANESDRLIGLNKGIGRTVSTSVYDEELVPYLQKILKQKSDKNRLIFIHLMGNHNRYSDRYPKKYDKYHDYLQKDQFGAIINKDGITRRLNSYDNSILYNDYVLHNIISEFLDANTTGALLYFSDHSEDVVNNLAHNPDKFTYAMCEIPLMVVPTKSYAQKYPQKYKSLLANSNKLFSNAFIYDSIIGITGIQTKKYNAHNDIASSQYNLDANETYTVDGKKLYASAENKYYQKLKNITLVHQKNEKISLKDFSSFSQLYEAYRNGVRNVSIKVSATKGRLFIVYNTNSIPFTDFTKFVKQKKMNLFLNVRFENVNGVNKAMSEIVKGYGTKVKFYLTVNEIERLSTDFMLMKNVGLALDNEKVYSKILHLSKSLQELSEVYKKVLRKYHLKSILFDKKISQFVSMYGLDSYVDSLLIATPENICSSAFTIQKNSFKEKKVIYEVNYCRMFPAVN